MKKTYKLLLVEDDPEDVLLFRKHLPAGYELDHVTTPEDARDALARTRPDVLFIDYRLGATDGLSLVRSLVSTGIRQPMVMMTGGDIEALGENALLAGATDFLAKADLSTASIERAARWSMIRKVVEARQHALSPSIELDELLALHNGPREAASNNRPETSLQRVMYVSRADASMTPQQFTNLCALSAANNQLRGITGVLAKVGNAFLQCVEGPTDTLEELVLNISRDERHTDLVIISDEPIRQRDFAAWNMGSFTIRRAPSLSPAGWLKRVQQIREAVNRSGTGKQGFAASIRCLLAPSS